MSTLQIRDLHVQVENKEILKGINLEINSNETVALLGPNGHGKSTLLQAIMGNPKYVVTQGQILLDGKDIVELDVDERSKAGLFLAMQNPAEVPGVNYSDFLKAAINARREKPIKLFELYQILEKAYKEMGIPFEMAQRNLYEGFSGGEKKKNEILQMIILDPKFALLDEIDSGLDVDAIQVVASQIRKEQAKGRGFLVVSHYARLFNLISPTRAAVIVNGLIVQEGGPELITKIDTEGYEWIQSELGIKIAKDELQMNTVSIGTCATKEAIKDGK